MLNFIGLLLYSFSRNAFRETLCGKRKTPPPEMSQLNASKRQHKPFTCPRPTDDARKDLTTDVIDNSDPIQGEVEMKQPPAPTRFRILNKILISSSRGEQKIPNVDLKNNDLESLEMALKNEGAKDEGDSERDQGDHRWSRSRSNHHHYQSDSRSTPKGTTTITSIVDDDMHRIHVGK